MPPRAEVRSYVPFELSVTVAGTSTCVAMTTCVSAETGGAGSGSYLPIA